MLDALLLLWGLVHSLEDPVVIVVLSSIGGGCGAAMRRLDESRFVDGVAVALLRIASGAVATAVGSGAAALVGMSLFPRSPTLILGLVVLLSGIVDTSTDQGRAWVLRELIGRLLAMFDAARNGGRYVAPTAPPTVQPTVPPTSAPHASQPIGTPPRSPTSSQGPTIEQGQPTQGPVKPKKGAW